MSILLRSRRALGKQRPPLALAALVAILVWTCDVNGWLDTFDNALYDIVAEWRGNSEAASCWSLYLATEEPSHLTQTFSDALRISVGRSQPNQTLNTTGNSPANRACPGANVLSACLVPAG